MAWGRRDEPGAKAGTRGRLGDRLRALGRSRHDVGSDDFRERTRWQDGGISLARPLLRPAPRSAMFFPLVVIVAVLPGLYALNNWDLTPPGPWWGLRALAVLDGNVVDQLPAASAIEPAPEAAAFRLVASQPPLYAWLAALGLALSGNHDPLAAVLPSYAAGVAVVVLIYLHGRLWRGPAVGLVAAVLTGFNRSFLLQLQQATPTTLALAGALLALYGYGRYVQAAAASGGDAWSRGGPPKWAAVSGVGLGLSLLAVGLFGLAVIPLVGLHQIYLQAGTADPWFGLGVGTGRERGRPWWRGPWSVPPGLAAGLCAVGVAFVIVLPWHLWMVARHGSEVLAALVAPFDPISGARPGLIEPLDPRLAPATLVLGVFAAARSVRKALANESDDPPTIGGVLWVLWLAVAALLPAVWPSGSWQLGGLFLLVPLNLLAAQAISDLAGRRVPVRALNWLAPLTAAVVTWCLSGNLRDAVDDLMHGRADAATMLGLHLAVDLVIAAVWLTHRIDAWARRRDDRQRQVLAGYLLVVLVVTVGAGGLEVLFRHKETDDLLMLRRMILRRDRARPFDFIAVVSPDSFFDAPGRPAPGGRLRFILRTALPRLSQHDIPGPEALLSLADALADRPGGQRLVVLAGTSRRLPADVRSRLQLEAIHPGRTGVLDAFATASAADGNRFK